MSFRRPIQTVPVTIACLCCLSSCAEETGQTPAPSKTVKSKPDPKPKSLLRPPRLADGIRIEDNGRRFVHARSHTQYRLPEGWTAEAPIAQGEIEFVRIHSAKSNADAEVLWIPLLGTLERAVRLRVGHLRREKSYGAKNVEGPKPVTIGPKTGWRIDMKVGKKRDPTKREVLYYFATAPGTKNRWRVGIRITLDNGADDTTARMLVNRFAWGL